MAFIADDYKPSNGTIKATVTVLRLPEGQITFGAPDSKTLSNFLKANPKLNPNGFDPELFQNVLISRNK